MKLLEFLPSPNVASVIVKIIYFENDQDVFVLKPIPRNYPAVLFVGEGPASWRIGLGDTDIFLKQEQVYCAGLGTLPSKMYLHTGFKLWVVLLQPQCGSVFGDAPRQLVNVVNPAIDISPTLDILNEQLWTAAHPTQAVALLKEYFSKYVAVQRNNPAVSRALQEIRGNNGALTVSELADRAFTCNRNLLRNFVSEVGVNPKKYSAMIRLSHFVGEFGAQPEADLESLAMSYGFYDSSHLYKELVKFYDEAATRQLLSPSPIISSLV
ncbi:MAG: AraC family transcriptional regulator [Chryseobacterium sp.]|nr:MAG: AraC family transcriptional regulator [Chryseobacterium sp.]